MANIPKQLLGILQELQTEELKLFQWHLTSGVKDFKHIPKALLEKDDRCVTVDKMVQTYGSVGAVEIMLATLKEMNQNQLAEELRARTREVVDISGENSKDVFTSTPTDVMKKPAVHICRSDTMKTHKDEIHKKFELRKYRPSHEGLTRLLSVVKNTRQAILDCCYLSKESCELLASVFKSHSVLRVLDLSNNDVQDSGVELLSAGLMSLHCKLEILRLSGCMVTEKGCSSLASALSSNPSNLKELDLTYNHPGDSGVKLLSARLEDPQFKLEILKMEHAGKNRIKQGLKKYGCELTLDPEAAHVLVEEGNRKVTWVKKQSSHSCDPERYDYWSEQFLCRDSLSGRCYWEAEWSGAGIAIGVAYKGITQQRDSGDCVFGWNEKSWSVICTNNGYSAWHNKKRIEIPASTFHSNRAGVYLDWQAGTLSFYNISSERHTLTHIHTFHSTFTEALYAGFRIWTSNSSIYVCQI
ncbi:uncharacterized protein LOC143527887 isoform X2 [Brachyhypopomus gauderio]|uniref:uncharacterized protein LOC143527887 isoform X2 n=1 Tax=Brachyhypopomus gauderio TaxID=698409 RepID=UPI00404276C0